MALEQKLPETVQFHLEIEQLYGVMHNQRHMDVNMSAIYEMCIDDICERYNYEKVMVNKYYEAFGETK